MEFDEKERREFDLRYNLLVNIQYAISLYQSFLLTMFQQENKQKTIDDYILLSNLQSKLTSYETSSLRQIYHDISIRLETKLNEG